MFSRDIFLRARNRFLLKADFIERYFSYNSDIFQSSIITRYWVAKQSREIINYFAPFPCLPETFIASRSATLLIDI